MEPLGAYRMTTKGAADSSWRAHMLNLLGSPWRLSYVFGCGTDPNREQNSWAPTPTILISLLGRGWKAEFFEFVCEINTGRFPHAATTKDARWIGTSSSRRVVSRTWAIRPYQLHWRPWTSCSTAPRRECLPTTLRQRRCRHRLVH